MSVTAERFSSSLAPRGGELLPAFGPLLNVAQRTNLAEGEALPHRRDGRRRLSDGHLQGARARSARVPRTRQKAPVHRPSTQLPRAHLHPSARHCSHRTDPEKTTGTRKRKQPRRDKREEPCSLSLSLARSLACCTAHAPRTHAPATLREPDSNPGPAAQNRAPNRRATRLSCKPHAWQLIYPSP